MDKERLIARFKLALSLKDSKELESVITDSRAFVTLNNKKDLIYEEVKMWVEDGECY